MPSTNGWVHGLRRWVPMADLLGLPSAAGQVQPLCCPGWPSAGSDELEELHMPRLALYALFLPVATNRIFYKNAY